MAEQGSSGFSSSSSSSNNRGSHRNALKPRKPLRRYGATVYAKVDAEWAGKALKALEHAPEIQVIAFVKVTHREESSSPRTKRKKPSKNLRKIVMRSLEFPRFWEGSEVDLFGDVDRGIVAVYHPSILDVTSSE